MSFIPYYSRQREVRNTDGMAVSLVDNGLLIRCVQMYEMLYVGNHPKSSDARFKEEIWEKIAFSMGIPVSLCKRSWFNLRDSYRRALRKRRDSFVNGLRYRKWRYEDEMEFLAPYISIRDPNDRVDPNKSNLLSSSLPNNIDICAANSIPVHAKIGKESARARSRRERNAQTKQNYQPRNLQMDHIDAFLVGIGATLKNFTPRNQNIAKSRIFSLVSDMEMQQIMEYKDQWRNNMPQSMDDGDMIRADGDDGKHGANGEANEAEESIDIKYPAVYMDEKDIPNKHTTSECASENAKESIAGENGAGNLVRSSYELQFCE